MLVKGLVITHVRRKNRRASGLADEAPEIIPEIGSTREPPMTPSLSAKFSRANLSIRRTSIRRAHGDLEISTPLTPMSRRGRSFGQNSSGNALPEPVMDAGEDGILFEGQAEPTLTHVGLRISHAKKGHGTLIRIADRLTQSGPSLYSVLFDDGAEIREQLQHAALHRTTLHHRHKRQWPLTHCTTADLGASAHYHTRRGAYAKCIHRYHLACTASDSCTATLKATRRQRFRVFISALLEN
jgi:hypothetical protein